ncbi:hypothetical protein KOR34_17380 [Posidoniimonas corsicana]|uniref:Transcription termination/antitermination protein NusG n=1 Tax=Posidoniimonas corsicana TaxID=1938618 RepID=A0A5C5VFE1_9BACT|nr:transcription termination/antitermination protein NusG [Posidoniimonas corsicana]TWT36793.1 hypothetical protein KOR34_17380 [Posidoniimonas corsicana]
MVEGSDKSTDETAVPADEAAVDSESQNPSEAERPAEQEAPVEPAAGEDLDAPEAAAEEPAYDPEADADLAAAEAAMDDEEPVASPAGPLELIEDEGEDIALDWYILKVQSNRERSISAALQRKVAIEGLDRYFGEIMVPTEKVTEFKAGKKKIVERKIWPGYIAVQMHVNDDTWFAIRETSGIGDFTGSGGKPTPMAPQDIAKILHTEDEETDEAPKLAIPFKEGDKVKVKDGNFESFEGEVSKIDDIHGKVTVMLSIFGRPTPVELEYWQVEDL